MASIGDTLKNLHRVRTSIIHSRFDAGFTRGSSSARPMAIVLIATLLVERFPFLPARQVDMGELGGAPFPINAQIQPAASWSTGWSASRW